METVVEKRIHILIILLLLVLSVFIMGISAGSIFADDGTEAGSGESTWLASGYLGNNEDVPWHVTSDWELIIGEDGNESSYIQEEPVNPANFYFPWQLAIVDTDQGTPVGVISHIRKVSFAGTVHLGGYCGKMFYNCSQLEEVDFSGLDSSGITDANAMFANCTELEGIDLSGLNTSGITNMGSMFYGCSNLRGIDLSGLDLHNVTRINSLFYNCRTLKTVDLSAFSTAKLTTLQETFSGCTSLQNVNLSGIDTSDVTRMDRMFYNCSALQSIDLSGLDTGSLMVQDEFHSSGSKDMFTGTALDEMALGSSTFPSDAGITQWVTRIRTLSGEPVKGPSYDGISAYDGSAPGWYKSGWGPDSAGFDAWMNDTGTGTGTGDDPGTGTGTGDDPGTGTGTGDDSGTGTGTGDDPGTGTGTGDDPGTGTGTGDDPGTGTGTGDDPGTGTGTGDDPGTGTGTGEDPGTGTGTGEDPGTGTGTGEDPGTGTGTGEDPGTGTGTGEDPGTGTEQGQGDGEHGTEGSPSGEQSTVTQRTKITSLSMKKKAFDYTGKRIRPAVVVKAGKRVLKKGTDYTVKYSNNRAVGKARVTVTGKGRYKGKLSKVFRIIPDRVKVKAKSYRIVEGTQIMISLSSRSKPVYYEFQMAKDRKFRKVIARKKFAKKKLLSGKIYAYKHLNKGRSYYIRIRLIKSGIKGRYSRTVRIKGRG